jgi:hypothetical protein
VIGWSATRGERRRAVRVDTRDERRAAKVIANSAVERGTSWRVATCATTDGDHRS